MEKVNTHEAKTQLSRLLRRVAAGEEITIANRGVPVARLVPVPHEKSPRVLGILRGQLIVPEDFDAPLPEDLLDLFEGRKKKRARKAKNRWSSSSRQYRLSMSKTCFHVSTSSVAGSNVMHHCGSGSKLLLNGTLLRSDIAVRAKLE